MTENMESPTTDEYREASTLTAISNDEEGASTSSEIDDIISISEFYNGRSIFITGGTGFMGKVLVEKLLRSCPGIKNIYLLIRPKRGQEINSRLSEIVNGPLFDKLRKERPNDLSKIIPIHGDITSEELGISEDDQALLSRSVSVVFHSAATVKFDEKLKLSVTINMLGTKRLVQLCQRMVSLDVSTFIHINTLLSFVTITIRFHLIKICLLTLSFVRL